MSYVRESASSSGELSSTSQISNSSGYLHGFELNPPSTGLATLKIYDGIADTSKLISTATASAGFPSINIEFQAPRICNIGIYATLTGNTTYLVGFSLG